MSDEGLIPEDLRVGAVQVARDRYEKVYAACIAPRDTTYDPNDAAWEAMDQALRAAFDHLASYPEGRAWLARLAFPPEQLKGLLDMDSVSVRHLNAAYEVLSAALGSASGEER